MAYPGAVEREYLRRLHRRVREVAELVQRELGPLLREQAARVAERVRAAQEARGDAARFDADEDLAERARALLARLRGVVGGRSPSTRDLVRTAEQVDRIATANAQRVVGAAAGRAGEGVTQALARVAIWQTPDARARAEAWAAENVSLITSIDARYFDDLERLFVSAIEDGTSPRSLSRILQERYEVSRSRATLIARDQISKLNGQIAEKRQTDLGITEYRWSTVGDERVRESHAVKDGRIFKWTDPPADTGHPGQDFQCRCVAEPVLPRTPRVGGGTPIADLLSRDT